MAQAKVIRIAKQKDSIGKNAKSTIFVLISAFLLETSTGRFQKIHLFQWI